MKTPARAAPLSEPECTSPALSGGPAADVSSYERMTKALALLVLLAAQPACTLAGLGAGIGMSASEPGPYEEQPLSPRARYDARAFEKLKLSKGDVVELVLLDGTEIEGEYLRLEPPTASDSEMYLLLVPERENGRSPSEGKTPRHVPLSEVRTLGVEVVDYAWIVGGVALGAALDALALMWLSRIYAE